MKFNCENCNFFIDGYCPSCNLKNSFIEIKKTKKRKKRKNWSYLRHEMKRNEWNKNVSSLLS